MMANTQPSALRNIPSDLSNRSRPETRPASSWRDFCVIATELGNVYARYETCDIKLTTCATPKRNMNVMKWRELRNITAAFLHVKGDDDESWRDVDVKNKLALARVMNCVIEVTRCLSI